MVRELELRVPPEVAYDPLRLRYEASTKLNVDVNHIYDIVVCRRSIDARQRRVMINLKVNVYIDEKAPATMCTVDLSSLPNVAEAPAVNIVGAGPAGLFAALRLIEAGLRPRIFERGKSVEDRARDMAMIARDSKIDPDSNYCFGEGGAGAYSDGKLYTRSKKRGSVDSVLQMLVAHGASPDILVEVHPHIGTDRLPKVISGIRNTILKCGGDVYFSSRITDIVIEDNVVKGVVNSNGEFFAGPVILATGHSARDVYNMLYSKDVKLEAKGIAVGVRLEHPQHLIDSIQYHNPGGRGKYLPAAEYSMLTRVDGRGVYSFCMCPGGVIIPAATDDGQLVVNGMSPASRGGKWANSGMVVEVLPEDLPSEYGDDPLRMMRFQQAIERKFYDDAMGTQNAPAQRMKDFVSSKDSHSLPSASYAAGIHPARIDKLLPAFISYRLQKGFEEFGRKSRGFLTNDATLIGAETRTSAPVRIPRNEQTLSHIDIAGLFPCGEGAGYAGGIVSAAIDGQRCAEAAAEYMAELPKPEE